MPLVVGGTRRVVCNTGSYASIIGTGDLTVSCWVYADSRNITNGTAQFVQLGSHDGSNTSTSGFWMQTQNISANSFTVEVGRTNSASSLYTGPTLSWNCWNFLAATHAGATSQAGVDYYTYRQGADSLRHTVSRGNYGLFFPPGGVATDSGSFGWSLGGFGRFFGMVAHVQAWTRILSQAEIDAAMVHPGSVPTSQTLWIPCERNGFERVQGLHGRAQGAASRTLL